MAILRALGPPPSRQQGRPALAPHTFGWETLVYLQGNGRGLRPLQRHSRDLPAQRPASPPSAGRGAAAAPAGRAAGGGGAPLTSPRRRAPPFPQPLRLLPSGPRRLPGLYRGRRYPPPSPFPGRGAASPPTPCAPPSPPPHRPRGRPLPPFPSTDAVCAAPALTWRRGAEERGETRAASGVSAGAATGRRRAPARSPCGRERAAAWSPAYRGEGGRWWRSQRRGA